MKKEGFLNEAISNYLLRLGWSYKNFEIINLQDSAKLFDLKDVGKSPARLDTKKIKFLNEHYLKKLPKKNIFCLYKDLLIEEGKVISDYHADNLLKYFDEFTERASTLKDIISKTKYFFDFKGVSKKYWTLVEKKIVIINDLIPTLKKINEWTVDSIENTIKIYINKKKLKFFDLGMPIRILLTDSNSSPSILIIMVILGKKEVIRRLESVSVY